MPKLLRSLPLLALFATMFAATAAADPAIVTIAFDFQGKYSDRAVAEMKKEAAGILKDAGLKLDWKSLQQARTEVHDRLVVVRFKGKCILEPIPILYDERGPLAFTHSTDGAMLPFSEVACDTVTATMRTAMWGGQYQQADRLLGRALGRVVAHELVHILTKSKDHAHEGVFETALSGRDLLAQRLTLSREEVSWLRDESGR